MSIPPPWWSERVTRLENLLESARGISDQRAVRIAELEREKGNEWNRAERAEREREDVHQARVRWIERAERAERERDDARAELEHASAANKGWEHQLRAMVTRTEKAEAERDGFKRDCLAACKLVADMHAAGTGRVGGPVRHGPVEDMADLRESAEKAEAACAAMRAALQGLVNQQTGTTTADFGAACRVLKNAEAALATDAGKDWVSPEQAAAMRAQRTLAQHVIQYVLDCLDAGEDIDTERLRAAQTEDAGKGWVSPEQASAMRTALRNAAGTLRFVIQRGHESEQPSAWIREPAEWCDAALNSTDAGRPLLEKVERMERVLSRIHSVLTWEQEEDARTGPVPDYPTLEEIGAALAEERDDE